MKSSPLAVLIRFTLMAISLILAGWSTGCSSGLVGGGANTTAASNPASVPNDRKPSIIYVSDFYIDPADLEQHTVLPQNGVASRVLSRVRGTTDPVAKAQELVEILSENIVKTLNQGEVKAERLPDRNGARAVFLPRDADLPNQGWIVGGWFTKADEGNAGVRAAVGLGAGSEHVEVQVIVSDLAGTVTEPFLFIGAENQVRRMPGGMITKNPYAIAAKMILSRGATERDVAQEGAAIGKKLLAYIQAGAPQASQR
jgi:hypothetical protein